LRHGVAGLGRMLPVVQADADDLLGVGHARPVFEAPLGEVERVAALTVLRKRREPRERLAAPPPLEDIVDRRWRLELHRLLGLLDVEDPAVRLDAEAHLVAALPA